MDAASFDADLEALLRESGWVRGLARGLLGEGAAADDLAQDVLAAALERRPGLQGARLRGWLRSVARRLAWRGRERGELRERAERETARAEDVEHESQRRLDLQRELAVAISELSPADRTVLVLRYFEGLSPRELAARLDLAEPAARKRVSRALEHLRGVLDRRRDGDRRAWSLALAGLAVRHDARAVTVLSAAGGGALLLSKTTWTLVGAAAIAALLFGVRRWVTPTPMGQEPIATGAPQPADQHDSEHRTDPVEPPRSGSTRRAVGNTDIATEVVACVRVVDAHGAAVPTARIAWVDADGEVRPLELDSNSETGLPDGSEGARFFAYAEGRGAGFARASDPIVDLVVTLSGTRSIRGRVIEDGGAPRGPILLRYGFVSYPGLAPSESSLLQSLMKVAAAPPSRSTTTFPDGSFRLDEVDRANGQLLHLPSTHHLLEVDHSPGSGGRSAISIPSDERELVLELARLPCVVGRMVWDDTSEPVRGTISLLLQARDASSEMITQIWLDDRGGFAFGIPIDLRALADLPAARGASVTKRRVRIWPGDVDSKSSGFEHIVDLAGVEYPLDVGTLRIPRAPILHVQVIGSDGKPLAGAVLATDLDRTTSDDEGRAMLAFGGGKLRALAVDHALTTVEPGGEFTSASAPLKVRLHAGATLEVRPPSGEAVAVWSGCSIRMGWDESPFEGAGRPDGFGDPEPLPSTLYMALFGRAWTHLGHSDSPGLPGRVTVELPRTRPLLIPGWRAGGVARLELLNATEDPVGSIALHVPLAPQRFHVELSELIAASGRLQVRAVDPAGRRIERLEYALTDPGRDRVHYVTVEGDRIELQPVALGTYDVTLRAPGYMEQEFTGLEVDPSGESHEVVLRPARRLAVSLVDSYGRVLVAQHAEVKGTSESWGAHDFSDGLVGSALFPRLPLEPLELSVRIGARTWTHPVDAEQTELALDLPAHGRLDLSVSARERLTYRNGRLDVRVRELEGVGALQDGVWVSGSGVGATRVSYDVLPGRYAIEVDLQEHPPDEQESDPPHVTPLLRREVEARAGETTEIAIGP